MSSGREKLTVEVIIVALNFKFVGKFPCLVIGLKFADKQLSCGAVTGDSNLGVLENLVFDYSNDSFCGVLSWDTSFSSCFTR